MSTRRIVGLLLVPCVGALALAPRRTSAVLDGGGSATSVAQSTAPAQAPETPTEVVADGTTFAGTIEVVAGSALLQVSQSESGAASPGPICSYEPWFEGRLPLLIDDGDGVLEASEYSTSYRIAGSEPSRWVDGPGPGVEMFAIERCPPGGSSTGARWVPTGPAVDIEAARLTGMSWDLGNGDAIECAGLGTAYPIGSNQIEQGPCGYTYTRVSDVGTRQVTATAHYSVQLTTSTGRNEVLDPVAASDTFDYLVYEIVTTGVA